MTLTCESLERVRAIAAFLESRPYLDTMWKAEAEGKDEKE
jgi:hypothetical protein